MFGSDFILSGLTTFLSMSIKYVFNLHLELKMNVTSTSVIIYFQLLSNVFLLTGHSFN